MLFRSFMILHSSETSTCRCEVCNIFFPNAQALGGHRTNSRDHMRRVTAVLSGNSSSLPCRARNSSEAYSGDDSPPFKKKGKAPVVFPLRPLPCTALHRISSHSDYRSRWVCSRLWRSWPLFRRCFPDSKRTYKQQLP